MTAADLKTARKTAGYSQLQAAARLGVSQAYLSMLERGNRPVTPAIAVVAAQRLPVPPTSLPFTGARPDHFEDALGALGYPGFAYIRNAKPMNPAELLLLGLDTPHLPARAVEGFPWLLLAFPHLDWEWLVREAKLRDRQNRLGYVVDLSAQAADRESLPSLAEELRHKAKDLRSSKLAVEGTLCRDNMYRAEREWLRTNSTPEAVSWMLLTDLKLSDLSHVHF